MALISLLQDTTMVFQIIVYFFVIGQIISSLEFVSIRREFKNEGLFSWRILKFQNNQHISSPFLGAIVNKLFNYTGFMTLLFVRIIALCLLILFPIDSLFFTIVALLLSAILLIMQYRQSYGGEGSDQMSIIISICLLLGAGVFLDTLLSKVSLWFIAAQSCLSYSAAGIAKLVSPIWRSGNAISNIFNTVSFGSYLMSKFLSRYAIISYILSWIVILFETCFPLCLVTPVAVTFFILFCGFIFHLINAMAMGLNSFLWIFIATYPAIIYTSSSIKSLIGLI